MAPTSAVRFSAAIPLVLALALGASSVASAAELSGAAPATATGRFLRAPLPAELGADMQQALSEALGVGFHIHGGRMLAAQASLEPVWRTMAKDGLGRVDSRSLRYMVHRHFLQRYHISVIGMETLQVNSSSSTAEAKLLAELTPNFVRSLLEGTSAEAGFSLEDVAALIAVIERLVEDAGHEQLEVSYKARGYDITDLLTRKQLLEVTEAYMLRWLYGPYVEGLARVEQMERSELEKKMRRWGNFFTLAEGHIWAFEQQHLHAAASKRAHGSGMREFWNPLRPLFSFADAQAVISSISTQFGRYWETECEGLMQVALRSERPGTGRLPLASFYNSALGGEWHFSESAAYLRQLGVLDESSRFRGPEVIAVNYIQASNNCLIAHKHFRVCCANPCQDFYSDLEAAVGAPEGEPEHILAIVSNFTYGFDDAAPRITKGLKAQLQEIAQANHGKIPLHGRLFAQWLHFVLPTECPFPRQSGSTIGLTPWEFGYGTHAASVKEMRDTIKEDKARRANYSKVTMDDAESEDFMNSWNHEEELLSSHLSQRPRSTRSLRDTVRPILYAIATISVLVIGVLKPAMAVLEEASEHGFLVGGLLGGRTKAAILPQTKAHFV